MPVVAECMFCEENAPCVTHADKPTKSSPRKPRQPKPSASTPPASPVTSEPTSPDFTVPAKRDRFGGRAEAAATLSEEDMQLREVVRNLWDILSPSSRNKYRYLVEPSKTPAQSKRHAEVRRMLDGNA